MLRIVFALMVIAACVMSASAFADWIQELNRSQKAYIQNLEHLSSAAMIGANYGLVLFLRRRRGSRNPRNF